MKPNRMEFEGIFNEIEQEILKKAINTTFVSLVKVTPVDTGNLKSKWQKEIRPESGVLTNNTVYADVVKKKKPFFPEKNDYVDRGIADAKKIIEGDN